MTKHEKVRDIKEILRISKIDIKQFASELRVVGFNIKKSTDDEQAEVLYWLLSIYERHGSNWKEASRKFLVGEINE